MPLPFLHIYHMQYWYFLLFHNIMTVRIWTPIHHDEYQTQGRHINWSSCFDFWNLLSDWTFSLTISLLCLSWDVWVSEDCRLFCDRSWQRLYNVSYSFLQTEPSPIHPIQYMTDWQVLKECLKKTDTQFRWAVRSKFY